MTNNTSFDSATINSALGCVSSNHMGYLQWKSYFKSYMCTIHPVRNHFP